MSPGKSATGAVAPPDLGGLGEFWHRLRGGAYPAFTAVRPIHRSLGDAEAVEDWPGSRFALLDVIRRNPKNPDQTVADLAGQMRVERRLLAAVLFTPDVLLCRLREARSADEEGIVDAWVGMCWTAEAAWDAVTKDGSSQTPADAEVLRPLAARLRFLTLSEPMRWRGQPKNAWWGQGSEPQFGPDGIMDRVFGPESWPLLVSLCREARKEWLACLDAYQSYLLLAQAGPRQLEQELAALVFQHGYRDRFQHAGTPLGMPADTVDKRVPLTAEDRAFFVDVADRHLLPRFALPTVVRLGLYDDARSASRARKIVAGLAAATGLAAVGCAVALLSVPATILAAACYLLICTGVVLFPAEWGAMWLLRMPAASAVGIIALIGLLPGGWVHVPPRGWLAAGALLAVSYGYLLVEARNHGVARGAALLRSALVAAIGAVHAALVSLIALVVITPAFVSDGKGLLGIWHQGGGHARVVLALSAAWCLAVGVFSQILWDDRPITATLAHLSWRGK